jgi:hypothetical protein
MESSKDKLILRQQGVTYKGERISAPKQMNEVVSDKWNGIRTWVISL